jgi:hypothetical protein
MPDAHARYEHLYSQITAYDTHFSAVRTTATTFLASVGVLSSLNAIDHNYRWEGFFIAVFFLFLGYWMNGNFALLSAKCQYLQKKIEEEIAKEAPDAHIERYQLRKNLKESSFLGKDFKWFHLDMHTILFIAGSMLYLVAIFIYFCTHPPTPNI